MPGRRHWDYLTTIGLFSIALAILILPAFRAVVGILFDLHQARADTGWDAAMVVEGWRAANGLPVYEDQITGHATTMYGFAEPYVLGALYSSANPAP